MIGPQTTSGLSGTTDRLNPVGLQCAYTVCTRYKNGHVVFWSHNCSYAYARRLRKSISSVKSKVRYYRQTHRHAEGLSSCCEECHKEGERIARLMSIVDRADVSLV